MIIDDRISDGNLIGADGLPIIPATVDRVSWMLEGTSRGADEVLGVMPPRMGELTIKDLAINAVQAGCLPEYMPVVITAMEVMLDDSFDLISVQTTTYPACTAVIVNGPIVKKLGINGGMGCYGPGPRANATIGRAVRLIMRNLGGLPIAGGGSRSTQGRPSRYSFCFAENEEANPWQPLHVEMGFDQDVSIVTVATCESPYNIHDLASGSGLGILNSIVCSVSNAGLNKAYEPYSPLFLVLCPEHAATLANDGFSKEDVKRFIHLNSGNQIRLLKDRGLWGLHEMPKWFNTTNDEAILPVVDSWEKVTVLVAGGLGKHSSWLPTPGIAATGTKGIAFVN